MTDRSSSPTLGDRRPPRPILDAFFIPRGILGRIGGRLMARGVPQQQEVADIVAAWAPRQICEVGCGPGVLAQLLAQRWPTMRLDLVDPSPIMRAQAGRRCQKAIAEGRVTVHSGSADALPFADEAFDAVVATNNMTMWPDLVAGLLEIRRVLQPNGRLVLSWHSANAPGSTERRLALPDGDLDTVTKALQNTFGGAQRRVGKYSVIWKPRNRAHEVHRPPLPTMHIGYRCQWLGTGGSREGTATRVASNGVLRDAVLASLSDTVALIQSDVVYTLFFA